MVQLSFKRFRQNVKVFTHGIKETGRPLVLTINRKPRFVVQDVKSYQQMLDLVDRLECIEGIRRGLEAVESGRIRPARASLRGTSPQIQNPQEP